MSADTDGACEDELGQFTLPCLDVYERSGGSTTWISTGGNGSHQASFASATPDGTHVFFHTTESLVAADNVANTFDVYDRSGGNTILVSAAGSGSGGSGAAFLAGISKDGARAFFTTYDQLVSGDADSWNDVYERYGGATTLISTGPASSSGNNIAFYSGNSEDGTKVIFNTDERLTGGDTDSEFDVYSASQVVTGFPRARGATPTRFALVPAYQACVAANRTHGPSLAFPSCNPPAQESSVLTVGTPDANGASPASQSSVRYLVYPGAAGPPDDSVLQMIVGVNDVRCRTTNAACPGGANSDYTGKILVSASIRLTDKLNGSPAVESGTMQDLAVELPVQCAATAGTEGGNCAVTTTVNALYPGSVLDGKRAIWEIGDLKVKDAGPNGTGYGSGCPATCGDGDETVFMRPGVFIP